MPSQSKIDAIYMVCADAHASLSKAVRKRVGACIVTPSGIIIPGYNGTPSGTSNCCERTNNGELITLPTVIHAELNCILKAATEGVSIIGSTLYVTLAPCLACSAFIKQTGINRVVYKENYRDASGINFLADNGVAVDELQLSEVI